MTNPDDNGLSPLKRAFRALEEANVRIADLEARRSEPMAIVGVGCRFPGGADGPAAYWSMLRDGRDAVTDIPCDRWDVAAHYSEDRNAPEKMSVQRGAFLKQVDEFDASFFGISPREAQYVDPQQRLLLEVAWEALEHAGIPPLGLTGSATGVFTGMCKCDYARMLDESGDPSRFGMYAAAGRAYSMGSGRLSYTLGLQGPSVTVDTACSSSMIALHLACQSVATGECRLALACGVNLILSPDNTISYSKAEMMSPDGVCRTFDAGANGFVQGEGCGVVVIKRVSEAKADGDRILALIHATAANQDGPSSGLTVPNGAAQEAVMRQALARAGISPADVDYVEAHGTGTSLGDPIEVRALGAVYGADREGGRPLLIGSVKTNMGHLESAAGIASVIKVALSLHHRSIPPHLHFDTPSPHIDWDALPIRVVTEAREWKASGKRRLAGISSFGFSGTNVHAIIGEAPAVDATHRKREMPGIFAVSARDETALKELVSRHVGALAARPDNDVDRLCYSASAGRSHFSHRLAICTNGTLPLRAVLSEWLDGKSPGAAIQGERKKTASPRVAFLFTGQGSQYVGMGRDLYRSYRVFREAIDRCEESLREHLQIPLRQLLFGDDDSPETQEQRLTQTGNAQPALFALEYSLAALWQSWGVVPAAVAGHSVGEYAAACLAGVFDLDDAARLIAARGRLMQALPAGGKMAAVLSDIERVARQIEQSGAPISIAAINGPGNTVVSGAAREVDAFVRDMQADNVTCHFLNVSHAFHSPLMEPMLAEFSDVLDSIAFKKPRITLVSNLTGKSVTASEIGNADYWLQQIVNPVRFADSVQVLSQRGCEIFVETGPHPVLIGQGRMCLDDDRLHWLPSMQRPERGTAANECDVLNKSVARYYAAGGALDWDAFYEEFRQPMVDLPTYPFQRKRYWFKPGARKPVQMEAGAHPLLGARIHTPMHAGLFRNSLQVGQIGFVDDHVVHSATVVPATAYLEIAVAAARECGIDDAEIVDATLVEALVLTDGVERTLQVVVDRHPSDWSLKLFSATAADDWTLHFETRLAAAGYGTEMPAATFPADRATMAAVDAAAFYGKLGERGLAFGRQLRGVSSIASGDCAAIGEIESPEEISADSGRYAFHPALLDACLQVLAAAVPGFRADGGDTALYMPFGIDRCVIRSTRSNKLTSYVRVEAQTDAAETLTGHVHVVDERGKVVALLQGMRLKRVASSDLARDATKAEGSLYELEWRELAKSNRQPAVEHLKLGTSPAAHQGNESFTALAEQHGLHDYLEQLSGLEALCAEFVLKALRDLGWQPQTGDAGEIAALADRLRVIPRHGALLRRFLHILAESGWLEIDGNSYTVGKLPAAPDPARHLQALKGAWPDGKAELELVSRCGPQLRAVLLGNAEPLELLFPGGDTEAGAAIYTQSPPALTYNSAIADTVGALISQLPAGRKLRVLEVGGGTGGTTRFILDRVVTDRLDYRFTDLGPLFVSRARERFGSVGCMSFGVLDIERDPALQGFDAGSYDLVIASNVLHATRDLRCTLGHVSQLLSPSGIVILSEVVTRQAWIDITFGMTEGWWLFNDHDLRPDYPLLTESQWMSLLSELGFSHIDVVPKDCPSRTTNSILIAARGATSTGSGKSTAAGPVLCFADRDGLAARMAETMASDVITVVKGEAFDARDTSRLVVDPANPDDFGAMLDETGDPSCVIFMWPLDSAGQNDASNADGPDDDDFGACRALLNLVQALLRRGVTPTGGLWLVTAGGQATGGERAALDPRQAPVWGFGKVIAQEHPELCCRRFDLDPSDPAASLPHLRDTIGAPGDDDEFACRDGRLLQPRLVRVSLPAIPEVDRSVRLDSTSRGVLDNLHYREVPAHRPGACEVEIRVRASGLNFRDVLNALGTYAGGEVPFGAECAGIVTAVGKSVKSVEVGDEVIAIALHAFADRVVANEALVASRPSGLSWSEAACLPIAFVTAHHCLHAVASLRAGERVLVHAGAGGVGMAAVQLALAAGAEVFATAGSDEKRQYLRNMGVAHVYDSRSLEFREAIAADTQGKGVHVVVNSLAAEFIPASLAVLTQGGRFVEIGRTDIWSNAQVASVRPDVNYVAVDLSGDMLEGSPHIREILTEVVRRVGDGELRALPVRTFSRDETVAAFRHMAHARHIGKIAVQHPLTAENLASAHGAYLITGGIRGLGLLVADWLVDRGARCLVLTGRGAPSKEASQAIGRMEQRGAEIHTVRGDIANAGDVGRLFETIRALRLPLRGIVHSAGALADAPLIQQSWRNFQAVFAAKVRGTTLLDSYTSGDHLDFFVLFSSIASMLGSPGQANHCAANSFLDVFSHQRRRLGLPAVCINWGIWSGTGAAVDNDVIDRAAARGLDAIDPEVGLTLLENLLCSGRTQTMVQPVRWQRFLQTATKNGAHPALFADLDVRAGRKPADRAALAAVPSIRDKFRQLPESARPAYLGKIVRRSAATVLEMDSADAIPDDLPLKDSGLDSLLAVELRNALGTAIGQRLPSTLLFDYPTIAAVVGYLQQVLTDGVDAGRQADTETSRAGAGRSAIDDLLQEVESLSTDEAERLVGEESRN